MNFKRKYIPLTVYQLCDADVTTTWCLLISDRVMVAAPFVTSRDGDSCRNEYIMDRQDNGTIHVDRETHKQYISHTEA